jgi:hypothetical protein
VCRVGSQHRTHDSLVPRLELGQDSGVVVLVVVGVNRRPIITDVTVAVPSARTLPD